jgi:hypothetical protein
MTSYRKKNVCPLCHHLDEGPVLSSTIFDFKDMPRTQTVYQRDGRNVVGPVVVLETSNLCRDCAMPAPPPYQQSVPESETCEGSQNRT